MLRSCSIPLLALLLVGCGTTASTDANDARASTEWQVDACRQLVLAEPARWPATMNNVLELGPEASSTLAALLREHEEAPGAEAATAVLGRLGGAAARTLLCELIGDRSTLSGTAALALSDCGTEDEHPLLMATAADRLADPTLRAACAATLLRLGVRRELRALVRGILLAGTPAGRALEQQLGLPHRPRWAYERYLLQLALRDAVGSDFGLDTDAPWAELERVANAIDAYLENPQ